MTFTPVPILGGLHAIKDTGGDIRIGSRRELRRAISNLPANWTETPLTCATAAPALRGVYAIKNSASGAIYIGSSRTIRERYHNWRASFKSGHNISIAMEAEINTAPRDCWVFIVLVASDDLSPEEMFRLEYGALNKARDAGAKILNGFGHSA
jgi:hypothetical protein